MAEITERVQEFIAGSQETLTNVSIARDLNEEQAIVDAALEHLLDDQIIVGDRRALTTSDGVVTLDRVRLAPDDT